MDDRSSSWKEPTESAGGAKALVLKLYISGRTPNSLRAQENLLQICEQYFPNNHQIEVINILEDPSQAYFDGILVTPTLLKVSPPPRVKITGDLSERERVLTSLGIVGGER